MLSSAIKLDLSALPCVDTIVVGAGAVGITMAIDLARNGHSVMLLEAGSTNVTKASQQFFESAKSIGEALEGLHLGRFRSLGGTTNFWGGQLVRFDPIVFRSRPWIDINSAWPITYDDLNPFYDKALSMLGIEQAAVADDAIMRRLNIDFTNLPDDLDFFFTRWLPEPNFARLFIKDLEELNLLNVIVDAPVVALFCEDNDAKKISGVEVVDTNGRRIKLKAKNIILANGTIEITRLLLSPLSDKAIPHWAKHPLLGKGFVDHIDCVVGEVKLKEKQRFHHTFDNAVIDGVKYQPKLKLTESSQVENKLVGIACHFIFNSSLTEHIVNAKIFFKALLRGKIQGNILSIPRQLLTIFRVGFPMVVRYIRYRRMYNPTDQGVQLRLTCEQKTMLESQLRLLDKVDTLGMPLIEMDWKIDGDELETISHFSQKVASYLQKSGMADVILDSRVLNKEKEFLSTIDDANHHMGMVRMSDDPKNGIVDANLCVYGTDNLYVAGAAVYPSTGFANPTFTAIALGLRLSNRLLQEK